MKCEPVPDFRPPDFRPRFPPCLKSAQESIPLIKNKYGKTDPDFAERAMQTQKKIVDEMTMESRKNNCSPELMPLITCRE
jgi:hypothetical protein